ncbi:MAG: DUF3822 family protein [Bacteroidia bacterium]|nr:DUF3822 family protein [Bacteroidia bacterium]
MPPRGQIQEMSISDLLIRLAAKSLIQFPSENAIFVLKKHNGFHLLLLKKDRLLFANTFDFVAAEEVLYFCLNILKDYQISQELASLFYSENEYAEGVVELWRPYFANLISLESHFVLPRCQGEPAFDLREFNLLLQTVKCV